MLWYVGTASTIVVAILLLLDGMSALGGKWNIPVDPSGHGMPGLTTDQLSGEPFADDFIPGAFLIAGNGLGSMTVLLLVLACCRLHVAVIAQGAFLNLSISVQVVTVRPHHWFQTLFFGIGVILVAGVVLRRNELVQERDVPMPGDVATEDDDQEVTRW
jgi:hypothetical protein